MSAATARRAASATFAPDPRRRAMIAKLHVAKKQLALAEDDYRQILFEETGHTSAADCDARGLEKVLKRLEAKGFRPLPKKGVPGAAQHPMARKARALWISLYHLGAVRNSSERALEAFAQRQLGCERLVWAKQSDAFRLIEALKAMAERNGWPQTDGASPRALNEALCQAILWKLKGAGEVPADWTIDTAAFRLAGIETGAEGPMDAEAYQRLAAVLGEKLRAAGGAE
ncbi:MAG: regulatory protein GemA [Porphyrobacter sp.]|jgi:phage gp16-like protein|nr:regulatory protein GemA [Porphyrobacter sp.]